MSSDVSELVAYKDKLNALADTGIGNFMEYATKQLAARFLSRVIPLTPVEEPGTITYRMAGGKTGTKEITPGALRRGWTGGKEIGAESFASQLPVYGTSKTYEIVVSNNVSYASYVESGHKQKVGKFVPYIGEKTASGVMSGAKLVNSTVEGQHMVKTSVADIEAMGPGLAQKLIDQFLKKNL